MTSSLQNNTNNMQLIVWVSPEQQEKIIQESLARYTIRNAVSRYAAIEISGFIEKVDRLIRSTHVTQVPAGQSLASQARKATMLLGVSALQLKLQQIAEQFKQKQKELHKITPHQMEQLRLLSRQIDTLEQSQQRLNASIAKANNANIPKV